MSEFSSYYLYQRYEKRGEQDWIPCTPNVYSISGDSTNPMPLSCKTEYDTACGYIPVIIPQYRWNIVDGFMCANCDQTKAMIHTSADTIYISGSGEITQAEVSGYTSAATDVVITSDATSIGNNAFSGFTDVDFVRIPSTITTIGDRAFYSCEMMTECQIPYGVTSIGNSAFTNSTSLMFVDIPNSVTSLGNYCFMNCLNFRYTSIPSSLTNIPLGCFYNCDGLTDIEIPSSVSGIGDSAFAFCSGLYSVTVNATTPPTLGASAFAYTNESLKIYVPCGYVGTYKSALNWSAYSDKITTHDCGDPTGATKFYATYSDGKILYEYCDSSSGLTSGTTRLDGYEYTAMTSAEIADCVTWIGNRAFYHCGKLTSLDIPDSVTSIGSGAFAYCSGLTSIVIPDSVAIIDSDVFRGCTSLTSIDIPSGVTSIAYSTFYGCISLVSVAIPNSVTYIGINAFRYCTSLTSIDIPSGVTSIGENVFYDCTSLASITVEATTPPTLGTSAFYNTNNDLVIYVPAASLEAYKSASGWSSYSSRIQPIT